MRAIDADALEEKVEHDYHHKKINRYDRDLLLHYLDVEMAPTIEPERKPGKWIEASREGCFSYSSAYAECSECGGKIYMGWKMKFCPNCGNPKEKWG